MCHACDPQQSPSCQEPKEDQGLGPPHLSAAAFTAQFCWRPRPRGILYALVNKLAWEIDEARLAPKLGQTLDGAMDRGNALATRSSLTLGFVLALRMP